VVFEMAVKDGVHFDRVQIMRRDPAIKDRLGDDTCARPQFDHGTFGGIKPCGHFRA